MKQAVFCPGCGSKLSDRRRRCPRCGVDLQIQLPDDAADGQSLLVRRFAVPAAAIVIVSLAGAVMLMRRAPAPQSTASAPPEVHAAPQVREAGVLTAAPETAQVADYPRFAEAGRIGGAAYARGDFATAVEQLQKAVERNPNDLLALNNLGQALVRIGRAPEAVPYFERAIALNGREWAPRFNLAHAYGEMKEWGKASAEYQTAAGLFPDDYVTHYNLGLALHKAGNESQAVTEFKKAIELAPGEASFHLSLGLSYEQLKQPADAAQAYEDYLTLAPDAPDARQVKNRIAQLKTPA